MRSQHCGYWCPGAKAPGHQYPQCWLNIHRIGPVSYKNVAHKVNSIRKWNHILKKKWPSHLRVKMTRGMGWSTGINSLPHSFKYVIFKHFALQYVIMRLDLSVKLPLAKFQWASLMTSQKVMAWCRLVASHYLNQCWPNIYCHVTSLGHNEIKLWYLFNLWHSTDTR